MAPCDSYLVVAQSFPGNPQIAACGKHVTGHAFRFRLSTVLAVCGNIAGARVELALLRVFRDAHLSFQKVIEYCGKITRD
jgi:hypothetical protein